MKFARKISSWTFCFFMFFCLFQSTYMYTFIDVKQNTAVNISQVSAVKSVKFLHRV